MSRSRASRRRPRPTPPQRAASVSAAFDEPPPAMNHLLRELAPISEAGWRAIDDDATSRLKSYLAARKVVDFRGPMGWVASSTDLGRAVELANPCEGVTLSQRLVPALVGVRDQFAIHAACPRTPQTGPPHVALACLGPVGRSVPSRDAPEAYYRCA